MGAGDVKGIEVGGDLGYGSEATGTAVVGVDDPILLKEFDDRGTGFQARV